MKNAILLAVALFGASGCAKLETQMAANGGLIGSTRAPYVVRNDSGGRIMDVWVLPDTIVMEGEHGAGFQFVDSSGNVVHLGGDARVIRLQDASQLKRWHDYHVELDGRSYQELWGRAP